MSFIEGIGDEVVLFFIIVCVFVLAALITFIGYIPHSRTVIERRNIVLNDHDENSDQPLRLNSILRNRLNPPDTTHPASTSVNQETADETPNNENSDLQMQEEEESRRTEPEGSSLDDQRTEGDGTEGREIRVRLKYLDDTERVVTTKPSSKIIHFKQRHFAESIGEGKVVRLIFAGRLLHDQATIEACRVMDHSVVHVQVLQEPGPGPARSPDSELDVGRLLVPVLTVILCMCWVTYSKHPELFTPLTLGILLSLSGFFFYFVYRTRH